MIRETVWHRHDEVAAIKQNPFDDGAYCATVDDVFQQVATKDGAIPMFEQTGNESFIVQVTAEVNAVACLHVQMVNLNSSLPEGGEDPAVNPGLNLLAKLQCGASQIQQWR
jgi:hypothetical protein